MKNILLASITCFILTLAAFGQTPSPTPVFKPKPTPEFKVSVIDEVVLVPVPSSTPRPQLTNNTKIEPNPVDELERLLLEDEQNNKPYEKKKYTPPGKPVLKAKPVWTYFGDGIEGENRDTSIYYRNAVRSSGGVELWLRVVYAKPVQILKKRWATFHDVFTTLDCDDRRISVESGIYYDKGGKIINIPFSSLMNEYRRPIVPDSVGDMIWKEFCRQ